ncbi:Glycosyltransferase involved in cell wall biogenesis [Roseomonas mucosa]|uniref:Glycosyltransferase involved in cell wall biogenesis n=1 Tax=Roseomonas mucosa TaxID=207340 RepID=A0A4Y1MTK7_9PROT|nr:glycosyltransferase family 2 protein [Roseomonas mucosa]AWV21365.1 Glycosyltransferase involved in cell wall biogenesis [Roseomonas mucosa]MDT8275392.1 glycosyltransferase family 2 protein [Roseomonas mucosa]MDT8355144.1 glycosyltransferase family 2 protein [Roseomonas mucosa]MDU7520315.1 glycosyltransferase family 2 protein [Roseomonas mucosa]
MPVFRESLQLRLPPGPPPPALVAIPARDEAEAMPVCLAALAAQAMPDGLPLAPGRFGVVLLVNNSRDGTAALARDMAGRLPFPLLVLEESLPPELAHAGEARRRAMEAAAFWLERDAVPDAVLLTTDADGRPARDWVARNLLALEAGADAVLGLITVDPEEHERALPAALRQRSAEEERYDSLLVELAARLDPDPADPWPRHDCESGASMAVALDAYRRAGGLPSQALGEDRAFCDALRRIDARLRHAPEAVVEVSCRLHGRAQGGMADTMRFLIGATDAPIEGRLEPALDAARRYRLRALARRLFRAPLDAVAAEAAGFGLEGPALAALLAQPSFGRAWEAVAAASPALRQRTPLERHDLLPETRCVEALLAPLRAVPAETPNPVP